MASMNRKRAVGCCPHCNEVPKEKNGIPTCACGKSWQVVQAVKGTEEEEKWLAYNGFEFAEDGAGDLYYVGPPGHILHLYPDGEWDSDMAPANCKSLEEYFELLAQAQRPSSI